MPRHDPRLCLRQTRDHAVEATEAVRGRVGSRASRQPPPQLATSLRKALSVDAHHLHELGLVHARDENVFGAAREANAIVVTKDSDFVRLLERSGPPPRVLWITLGNVSNAEPWQTVERNWGFVCAHFDAGEPLVEIGRAH